jgi:hypothetical protein
MPSLWNGGYNERNRCANKQQPSDYGTPVPPAYLHRVQVSLPQVWNQYEQPLYAVSAQEQECRTSTLLFQYSGLPFNASLPRQIFRRRLGIRAAREECIVSSRRLQSWRVLSCAHFTREDSQ